MPTGFGAAGNLRRTREDRIARSYAKAEFKTAYTNLNRRKVIVMKRSCKQAVLVLFFVLVFCLDTGATTCVANKIFKVKRVCGRVVDPTGVPIPRVEVELLDSHSNILRKALTNDNGIFDMENVLPGQYIIRVQFAGFAAAWQPFVLTKNKLDALSSKPMQVHLALAGSCSSVNKPK